MRMDARMGTQMPRPMHLPDARLVRACTVGALRSLGIGLGAIEICMCVISPWDAISQHLSMLMSWVQNEGMPQAG